MNESKEVEESNKRNKRSAVGNSKNSPTTTNPNSDNDARHEKGRKRPRTGFAHVSTRHTIAPANQRGFWLAQG